MGERAGTKSRSVCDGWARVEEVNSSSSVSLTFCFTGFFVFFCFARQQEACRAVEG